MSGRVAAILVVSAWIASPLCVAAQTATAANVTARSLVLPEESQSRVLRQYCFNCHDDRVRAGGLLLDGMDVANVPARAEVWEKVVRKLRVGLMPPQGAPRPDRASYDGLIGWLERALDRGAAARPNPGRPLLHRLNRVEYGNAIRDLLALDVDVASLLPADDSDFGFDNIADVLGVSPALQERYLSAARTISALAVGDPKTARIAKTYRVRQDFSQNQHVDGLPLGTVGGLLVRHTFPVDGEYALQVKLNRTNTGAMRGLEYPHQLEISVDGQRVHLAHLGGDADLEALFDNVTKAGDAIDARLQVRIPVQAGPRDVAVAFLQKTAGAGTVRLRPFLRSTDTIDTTGLPHIDTVTVAGPFNVTGPGDTPSRRKIFVCQPGAAGEKGCATRIVANLARRAFRRPITDEDLRLLLGFYDAGRLDGTFESGIQLALQRVLASPQFVFRVEADPISVAPGGVYRLSDVELASRLSFFLWSSIPDDQLLDVASHGKLKDPVVLAQQVRRMLADPRADALVSNFAGQWLYLRNLRSIVPNSNEFPDFDDNLRRAFQRETELFFASVMREDRNVLDLLRADYTFVNERLARHYGMSDVYGSSFRRVTVVDDARKGLLGHGSILTVTSHADRTSPVLRGKWILENLLGAPPPPPPPNVPPLKETGEGDKPRSMRERIEEHRANPVCASCHKLMDPIGLAMENFDAVGSWRTRDSGTPIDASGQLVDGTRVDGVVTLREALLARPDVFVRTMSEKLLTYALGRGLDHQDMPVVRGIVRDAALGDNRFSSLVLAIVRSPPFQMRVKSM